MERGFALGLFNMCSSVHRKEEIKMWVITVLAFLNKKVITVLAFLNKKVITVLAFPPSLRPSLPHRLFAAPLAVHPA